MLEGVGFWRLQPSTMLRRSRISVGAATKFIGRWHADEAPTHLDIGRLAQDMSVGIDDPDEGMVELLCDTVRQYKCLFRAGVSAVDAD